MLSDTLILKMQTWTFPHFKQSSYLAETISLFCLHVVTSPPELVGWETTVEGCTGNISSSDSRTKMTASPLTFIKHWAWKKRPTHSYQTLQNYVFYVHWHLLDVTTHTIENTTEIRDGQIIKYISEAIPTTFPSISTHLCAIKHIDRFS